MEISCAQMDVLISFYLEGDLSKTLKSKVEEHLKKCACCRAKYDIIKTMVVDMQNTFSKKASEDMCVKNSCSQYRLLKENLSAYVDNELPSDENIKIRKFAINNKQARKELEDTYNIRKLMSDSFSKTIGNIKQDFSKKIIKQLDLEDEENLKFHPLLKVSIAFVLTVLSFTAIIIFSFTL